MKPVEVNEDNFEALLAYDDLFLDYFNAFLSLPAFPQPLYYNRLTGTFQEAEDDQTILGSVTEDGSPQYQRAPFAPTDDERERIFEWARRERLLLFLRTKLFLEYKLCKLLTRPMDEKRCGSRQSVRNLRGYSRTTTYTSNSSLGGEPSWNGNESDWPENEGVPLFRYLRPGSRCISLPPMLGLGHYSPIWTTNAHSVVQNGDTVRNPGQAARSSNSAGSIGSNVKHSAIKVGSGRLGGESFPHSSPADRGGGGDNELGGATVDKENTLPGASGTKSRAIKSALKSSGSKSLSPKKKATIKIPGEEEIPNSQAKIHSSASQFTNDDSSPGANFFGSDDGGDDADDEDDEDDLIDMIDSDDDGVDDDDDDDDDDPDEDDAAPSTIDLDEDEVMNDERTVTELRQVEGKHKMSFQQIKEELLGSLAGMDALKTFLKDTTGEDMLNFWLDCELYRDNVQALGETHANITRTRLFRNIQDKYKFKLTSDAIEQIKQAQGNTGLSESVFTRTQYDVLRRLRSYWLARFILHQERMNDFSLEKIKEQQIQDYTNAKSPQLTFLPSISLVKSLPVRPSSCVRLATTSKDWSKVAMGGRQMQESIQPGYLVNLDDMKYIPRPLSARFHVGLACDREAGRPFQKYLETHPDQRLLSNLLFWQEVIDYGIAEDRAADRMLRMGQAWSIFSRFIIDDGVWDIGLPAYERDRIHTQLLLTSDFVEASTFQKARDHAVHRLQVEWLHYLKEDLRVFLECRARPEDTMAPRISSPSKMQQQKVAPSSKESSKKLSLHLPKPKAKKADTDDSDDSDETESSDHDSSAEQPEAAPPPPPKPEEPKVLTKKQLLKVKRKEQKAKEAEEARIKAKKEKLKKTLALQKKICRQVRKERANRDKPQKQQPVQFVPGQAGGIEGAEGGLPGGKVLPPGMLGEPTGMLSHLNLTDNRIEGGQPPQQQSDVTFKKMYKNKSVMSSFRNFMTENNSKEGNNMLSMYLDIDMVSRIADHQVERKFHQLKQLVSNYFDPDGKRAVTLQHDILMRLSSEGDRVSSKTLELAQRSVIPEIEKLFSQFWAAHLDSIEEQGARDMDNMRAGSVQSIALAYKKRRRGKVPNSGQQMPTGQDKTDFQAFLLSAARGIPPPKLLHFHRHLIEYGDKDALPLLEKDLIFYLEAQRFKEAFYSNPEMPILKRKVEVIIDCFLDSAVSHPPVQIDAPPEVSSKVLKSANNFMQDKGKDPYSPNIFEDAQYAVFKEMLPYWASFTRRYDTSESKRENGTRRIPSTRVERLARERLRMFTDMAEPKKDFKLPALNSAPQNRTGGTGITFSLTEGLQWKNYDYMDGGGGGEERASTPNTIRSRKGSAQSTMSHKFRLSRANTDTSSIKSAASRHGVTPKVSVTAV